MAHMGIVNLAVLISDLPIEGSLIGKRDFHSILKDCERKYALFSFHFGSHKRDFQIFEHTSPVGFQHLRKP